MSDTPLVEDRTDETPPLLIDSHTHAWRRWPYSPQVPDEDSRGTVEQLVYELDEHGVAQALLVCASIENNPFNVEYATFARERYPGRFHVLVDLDCRWSDTYHAPGSADRLRVLLERYELAGFTHYLEDNNDGWLRSTGADELFALAAERKLIVSLGAAPCWQSDLRNLARRYPSVPVLCHILGGFSTAGGSDSSDVGELLSSAAVPNILLKLAGFHYCAYRAWDYPWPDVLAVLARLAEAYTPNRLCWGSDFPASTRYCTFTQSLEVVRTHCPFFSADELRLVLGGALEPIVASGQATEP